MKGWPGGDDLGGWLHTKMVYEQPRPQTVTTHPAKYWVRCRVPDYLRNLTLSTDVFKRYL